MIIKRKIAGWGVRGRPFSQTEFKRSNIKTSLKMTYPQYLSSVASMLKRKKTRDVFK